MSTRYFMALCCIAVALAVAVVPAHGAILPWFGNSGGGRDDAMTSPLQEMGLLADPFRILEHVPFGFDRDDVAMLSMARVDWRETSDAHEIVVDVPGMRKEDIKVEIEENRVLRISGERRREVEERKGDHWHREERSYGRFWRQMRLPDNADLDTVAASLDAGVLTVRFRKLAPDQIKGPRVVGIAGGDDGAAAKTSIGDAGKAAGEERQAKKVEL
ncbi:23.2 kDa heat shock protein-like [Lolium perenne]|uniref:23.2 kDa heat shock protein-like n=1 Tax=Lolium perenne TaxID=4522 RepID=UPI0021EA1D41|nr:23.2 kDa heat shock protein-like [Lolium perenne]